MVAAVVLFLLAGYAYWLKPNAARDESIETVFDVATDAIARVEIRRADEDGVIVAREDGTWRVVSPINALADASEVELVLENLATMALERAIPTEAATDRGAFGIETPRLEVRFFTADGAEHGLRFGKDTLTPANQYAERIDDAAVLVVASVLSNNLGKTAWDLRDKAIFNVREDVSAKHISVRRPDDRFVLEREGERWIVTTPPRARANRFYVTGFVSRFRRAEMVDIAAETAEDLSEYGLASPRLILRIELDEGEPIVLEVGNKNVLDYFARNPSRPPVFLLEAGLVEKLEQDARELWSTRLFDTPAYEVTRFQINARRVEQATTDAGDLWREAGTELDKKTVDELLSKLTAIEATDIRPEAPPFEPITTITLWTETAEEEIKVGKEKDDTVIAQRRGDAVTLELNLETWREIEALLNLDPV